MVFGFSRGIDVKREHENEHEKRLMHVEKIFEREWYFFAAIKKNWYDI